MGEPFRLPAQGPVGAYQTFSVRSRPDRAVRTVCEQVACPAWREGWESVIDERTSCGAAGTGRLCDWAAAGRPPCGTCQAYYIRRQSGRTFREMKTEAGLTVFRFEPWQRCFADHKTRPELYLVRDGDYRGNPTGRQRQHTRPADWVEHMQEEFGRFNEDRHRG